MYMRKHGTNAVQGITVDGNDATWNSIVSFSTSWNAVTTPTVGIAILGDTGTTTNQYFEFARMRVSKHAMDF